VLATARRSPTCSSGRAACSCRRCIPASGELYPSSFSPLDRRGGGSMASVLARCTSLNLRRRTPAGGCRILPVVHRAGILLAYLSNWLILRFAQATRARSRQGVGHWTLVAEYGAGCSAPEMVPCLPSFCCPLSVAGKSPALAAQSRHEARGWPSHTSISGPSQRPPRDSGGNPGRLVREEGTLRELLRPD